MKKGNLLKLLALVFMTADHLAIALYSSIPIELYWCFRCMGRIAFPIYCYCCAAGFCHTRNELKYISRIFAFALISEIPFNLLINGTVLYKHSQNTLFTLFAGLCCLYAIKNFGKIYAALSCIGLMLAAYALGFDYGALGVLLIIICYLFKDEPKKLYLSALVILALMWVNVSAMMMLMECIGITGIFLARKLRGKASLKYLFYIYYPCHLIVLYFLWRLI